MAFAICMAEGGCQNIPAKKPNWDGSMDYGVFQINDYWHYPKVGSPSQHHPLTKERLLDVETNVRVAAQIKYAGGWSQWSTFKNNKYKEHLNGK